MKGRKAEEKLLGALQDFTSRENWDEFFKIRSDKPFEWYGDWTNLAKPLAEHCGLVPSEENPVDILVPGCGNSELSEMLYDAGFKRITNIDFSKVVIGDMLRKHLRVRPGMLWRVMDMTHMQFSDGAFDVVIDKGGLDALMEPELGPILGIQFLSEVKRVLRSGGRYICISLVQTHVIELLFSKFRFGWQVSVHAIPQQPASVSSYHPFIVAAVKENSSALHSVATSFDSTSLTYNKLQVKGLLETIAKENKLRNQHSDGEDIVYSFEELQIGAKGNMKQLVPGRRTRVMLGKPGISRFNYNAIIMDSYERFGPFSYGCGVFLVPKARAHEWLFSSEEGQWQVVESAKAGRLIMVFLDANHCCVGMEDVQKDLSPLVEGLAPVQSENGSQIPFMMASDGVAKRTIVQEVDSPLTGRIIVEDVIFSEKNGTDNILPENEIFRRLLFDRTPGLVQSEALLKRTENPNKIGGKLIMDEAIRNSRSRKKKNRTDRYSDSSIMQGPKTYLHVDHTYLASLYHGGMITGLGLIISELELLVVSGNLVKTVIIGLGAGLLPMFLHERMPFLKIEVVELDPIVADLARENFGFIEDAQMKLHIGDGVDIVKKMTNISNSSSRAEIPTTLARENECGKGTEDRKGVHVLIIDADSDDPSTGLTCPHSTFVEESFLKAAKESLVAGGILILNLVSRSTAVHEMVVSRMQMVFEQLFSLEIEEDVNKILFALPKKGHISNDGLLEAVIRLEKLLTSSTSWGNGPNIKEYARKMKSLK